MNPAILPELERLLPERGYFVEVGAYDGESHSLTCALADKGWSGEYFEPVPEYYERCKKRHEQNDVGVHNLAIGDGSEITLNVNGELTSSKSYVAEVFANAGWTVDEHLLEHFQFVVAHNE